MGSKRKLPARAVVADIRAGMDDGELRRKYDLSSHLLQKLFDKLIQAGMLDPEEIKRRGLEIEVPLDEAPAPFEDPLGEPQEPPPDSTDTEQMEARVREMSDTLPQVRPDDPSQLEPTGATQKEGASTPDETIEQPVPAGSSDALEADDSVLPRETINEPAQPASILEGLSDAPDQLIQDEPVEVPHLDEREEFDFVAATAPAVDESAPGIEEAGPEPSSGVHDEGAPAEPDDRMAVTGDPNRGPSSEDQQRTRKIYTASFGIILLLGLMVAALMLPLENRTDPPVNRSHGLQPRTVSSVANRTPAARPVADRNASDARKNARDSLGITPLMRAALRGQVSRVKALLDSGADVNARDKDSETALMAAAYGGYAEIVRLLLEAGAEVHVRSMSGQTALSLAVERGNREAETLLRTHGAKR